MIGSEIIVNTLQMYVRKTTENEGTVVKVGSNTSRYSLFAFSYSIGIINLRKIFRFVRKTSKVVFI